MLQMAKQEKLSHELGQERPWAEEVGDPAQLWLDPEPLVTGPPSTTSLPCASQDEGGSFVLCRLLSSRPCPQRPASSGVGDGGSGQGRQEDKMGVRVGVQNLSDQSTGEEHSQAGQSPPSCVTAEPGGRCLRPPSAWENLPASLRTSSPLLALGDELAS